MKHIWMLSIVYLNLTILLVLSDTSIKQLQCWAGSVSVKVSKVYRLRYTCTFSRIFYVNCNTKTYLTGGIIIIFENNNRRHFICNSNINYRWHILNHSFVRVYIILHLLKIIFIHYYLQLQLQLCSLKRNFLLYVPFFFLLLFTKLCLNAF